MDTRVTTLGSDGETLVVGINGFTSGTDQLVQQVVINLLSDYRADTGRGGNLVPTMNAAKNYSEARGAAETAVRATQSQILQRQQNTRSQPNERLRSLRVRDVRRAAGSWAVDLDLTTAENRVVAFSLG